MTKKALISIIQYHPFFEGLNQIEQKKLENIIHSFKIRQEHILLKKMLNDTLFIVEKGTLSFFINGVEFKRVVQGEVIFGEMISVAQGDEVSVQASPFASIYALRISDLKFQVEFRHIYNVIFNNLGKSQNIINSHDDLSQSLWRFTQNELELRIKGIQYFVFTIILLLCLYIISLSISLQFVKAKGTVIPITLGFTVISTLTIIYTLKKTKISPAAFGFTLANTRLSIQEALVTLPFLMLLVVLLKWILIVSVPALHSLPLFDMQSDMTALGGERNFWLAFVEYPLLSAPLQEIVFRGGIQGSLQLIFTGSRSMWKPIFAASILFATVHMLISPYAAIMIFFPGLFWGWLFARHHNLFGVCISHAILGTFAFFFMGYFQLIRML